MVTVPTRAAEKYIRSIRNVTKKAYAQKYYEWILAGRGDNGPEYAPLCYMAAQGVRMHLDEIYPQVDTYEAQDIVRKFTAQ